MKYNHGLFSMFVLELVVSWLQVHLLYPKSMSQRVTELPSVQPLTNKIPDYSTDNPNP